MWMVADSAARLSGQESSLTPSSPEAIVSFCLMIVLVLLPIPASDCCKLLPPLVVNFNSFKRINVYWDVVLSPPVQLKHRCLLLALKGSKHSPYIAQWRRTRFSWEGPIRHSKRSDNRWCERHLSAILKHGCGMCGLQMLLACNFYLPWLLAMLCGTPGNWRQTTYGGSQISHLCPRKSLLIGAHCTGHDRQIVCPSLRQLPMKIMPSPNSSAESCVAELLKEKICFDNLEALQKSI